MIRVAFLVVLTVPAFCQDHVDLGIIDRIKAEAFERSKVMETLRNLSDVHGPRLTGSPGFEDAARWAMTELIGYGLDKVHLEKWGPFGRAWTLEQSSLEMVEPRYSQLTAVPLAWSDSSKGQVTADLVLAPMHGSFIDGPKKFKEEWQTYQTTWSGKLRGKIVLITTPKVPAPQTNPLFRRYTDTELADMQKAPAPSAKLTGKRLEDLEWPEPADIGKFFNSLSNGLMDQVYDSLRSNRQLSAVTSSLRKGSRASSWKMSAHTTACSLAKLPVDSRPPARWPRPLSLSPRNSTTGSRDCWSTRNLCESD